MALKKGDFKKTTRDNVMFRAGLICSNPSCMVLTVGPVGVAEAPAIKIGEAAHIVARSDDGARSRSLDPDRKVHFQKLSSEANAIWLCSSCHKLIDKNKGADFPEQMLQGWKAEHEKLIKNLYKSSTSPVPHLRRKTDDGKVAQVALEIVEEHGMLIGDLALEDERHVLESIKEFRRKMQKLSKEIEADKELKKVCREIASYARDFMNFNSRSRKFWEEELKVFRRRCGLQFNRLVKDWNCKPGPACQKLILDYT